MRTSKSSRRRAGTAGAIALACAAAIVLAGAAHAATTAYPAGPSTFDAGPDDWTGGETTCLLGGAPLLCEAENVHDAGAGDPPGSIATDVSTLATVLGLLSGGGTWTSPQFTAPTGQVIDGATFSYDRRFDDGTLAGLTPTSTVTVELVDETAGTTATLLTDPLTGANSVFEQASAPAAVVAGHTYRLRISTVTAASVISIGLGGTSRTSFDNVALTVSTSTPPGGGDNGAGGGNGGGDGDGGGGDGGGNSPGVTIVRGPYTDVEIANLIDRYGGQIHTDAGTGRDGSLIPLEVCTILGTSGPDRIRGTTGNDVICGLGGDDTIGGGGGRDVVDGASGDDRLSGGIRDDLLLGLAGDDRIAGGTDDDRIGGGAGNDRIESGNGNDVSSGGSGNDAVGGEAGADRLFGRDGNDRINGGPGRDRLLGGRGNDVLRGFSGFDRHVGGPGRDRLLVRDGRRDIAHGGPGFDRALADRRRDRVRAVERLRRR